MSSSSSEVIVCFILLIVEYESVDEQEEDRERDIVCNVDIGSELDDLSSVWNIDCEYDKSGEHNSELDLCSLVLESLSLLSSVDDIDDSIELIVSITLFKKKKNII